PAQQISCSRTDSACRVALTHIDVRSIDPHAILASVAARSARDQICRPAVRSVRQTERDKEMTAKILGVRRAASLLDDRTEQHVARITVRIAGSRFEI